MYLNTLDVKLASRKPTDSYNLRVNASTLEILSLVLEFKIAASWHISRFTAQKDQSKYIYTKLRRIWQAGFLESFKVFSDSFVGGSVFYILSKKGLRLLLDQGLCQPNQLRSYPEAKALLSWGLFKHEAQVVELASLEAKNKTKNLGIAFKGEASSQSYDVYSNKNIEVLTPDYTVFYKVGQITQCIYSEFERTLKSKQAILNKIQRYLNFLTSDNRKYKILRLIFHTEKMEQAFWLNILTNRPSLLQSLKILTTNLSLIKEHKQFLEPIYLSDRTVKFIKDNALKVDSSQRIKLFPFL